MSNQHWLSASDEDLLDHYIRMYQDFIESLPDHLQRKECISGLNRLNRIDYWSSKDLALNVKPGDICYFEYGHAFLNEAGYQHFGLVMSLFNQKAFVIPMTSNQNAIRKATQGKHQNHLYYIGQLKGLDKRSVLFLNDCKFINTCRIISVNAHLDVETDMFEEIQTLLKQIIF